MTETLTDVQQVLKLAKERATMMKRLQELNRRLPWDALKLVLDSKLKPEHAEHADVMRELVFELTNEDSILFKTDDPECKLSANDLNTVATRVLNFYGQTGTKKQESFFLAVSALEVYKVTVNHVGDDGVQFELERLRLS